MTSKVKLTAAQRVALERVRDERIYRFESSGNYWTPGWGKRPPRRDVLNRLFDLGLFCPMHGGPTTEGIRQILTNAGLEALGASA